MRKGCCYVARCAYCGLQPADASVHEVVETPVTGSSIKEVAYRGAARWQADDTSHQLFVCEYGAECAAERCGVCDAEGVVEDEMGW